MAYLNDKKPIAQGEITFWPVTEDHFGDVGGEPVETTEDGRAIVAHSETGHHHVLDRPSDVSLISEGEGIRVLRLIVKEPTKVKHLRPHDTHADITLDPGVYEGRTAREYDPYAQMARRVAD